MSVSNHTQYISASAHGHQSNYQGQTSVLRHENDVEKRIQARIAKDGIRIKEFFIDFDKLRKGHVGEAAVSSPRAAWAPHAPLLPLTTILLASLLPVPHLHRHPRREPDRGGDGRPHCALPRRGPARPHQLPRLRQQARRGVLRDDEPDRGHSKRPDLRCKLQISFKQTKPPPRPRSTA